MMSKKIAQLTKVIYYLNTKNEDHGLEVDYLTENYEDEIKEVVEAGSEAIQSLQTKFDEAQAKLKAQEQIITAYSETIKKKEDEIRQKSEQYETLVKEIQEKQVI
ncbi:hypothetical protein EDD86DRAFT_202824 [Gorgonomyces haynaldii]|nr:hypothetical protein EDD86DRAFT_202824 [Gorgonomyces haynaldii]